MNDFIIDWFNSDNQKIWSLFLTGAISVVTSIIFNLFLIDPIKEKLTLKRIRKRLESTETGKSFILEAEVIKTNNSQYLIQLKINNILESSRKIKIESYLGGNVDSGSLTSRDSQREIPEYLEILEKDYKLLKVNDVTVSRSGLGKRFLTVKISPCDWGESHTFKVNVET